jgi:hypothetical protein
MPRVEFEPTISVFELAKTVHDLVRVATAIVDHIWTDDNFILLLLKLKSPKYGE